VCALRESGSGRAVLRVLRRRRTGVVALVAPVAPAMPAGPRIHLKQHNRID